MFHFQMPQDVREALEKHAQELGFQSLTDVVRKFLREAAEARGLLPPKDDLPLRRNLPPGKE